MSTFTQPLAGVNMPQPPEISKQPLNFIAERKKKARNYIIMCVLVAIPAMHFMDKEDGFSVFMMGVLLVIAITFFYKCYKCPSCKKYVNILWPPKLCPKCGVQLKA
jgi:ssDNA-binding Zn-finger/Zn-ribbon topoisomerase 1